MDIGDSVKVEMKLKDYPRKIAVDYLLVMGMSVECEGNKVVGRITEITGIAKVDYVYQLMLGLRGLNCHTSCSITVYM